MGGHDSGNAEISFVIISKESAFVKRKLLIFSCILGDTFFRGDILDNLLKKTALFALGGGSYVGLELLWRKRSHGSMFLAGGTGFLLLGQLSRAKKLPPVLRSVLGAGMLTGVELATGCVFNRRWQVWDYRGLPGNYLGQICPAFTLLWVPLAAMGEVLYTTAERTLNKFVSPKEPEAHR